MKDDAEVAGSTDETVGRGGARRVRAARVQGRSARPPGPAPACAS